MADDDSPVSRADAAVILERHQVSLPFMVGELPGSDPGDENLSDLEDQFAGGFQPPPVPPMKALRAVLSNGELAAVLHAVGEGTAGVKYEIQPRFANAPGKSFNMDDPSSWPEGAQQQRDLLQVFIQAGFQGRGAQSLREGFYEQEHDRVMLGWGGVLVHRKMPLPDDSPYMPMPPRALGRFEACHAQFTKPQSTPTFTPVPIALEDGRILWIEEPRHFRRIRMQAGRKKMWFKEYGDWRLMDARTGRYASNSRHIRSIESFQPGKYYPGTAAGIRQNTRGKVVPAIEVMHWNTSFPGVAPYGISGWHSELDSVSASAEGTKLLLSYLKSGLHSVILAAANRPFESQTAEAAIEKIDSLGRGREGLGALITLALVPGDSSSQQTNPFAEATADRGRLILHELNTKLPQEVMNGEMRDSLGKRFAHSERIPALLLGKSDSYNFATASAAWAVVNRLRFNPHHEIREQFLDRLLVEMGITLWRIRIASPEWEEPEPLASVASIAGSNGGLSVNKAVKLLNEVLDVDVSPIDEWWGNLPMSLVTSVLSSVDPAETLELLGLKDEAAAFREAQAKNQSSVTGPIGQTLEEFENQASGRAEQQQENTEQQS